MNEDTGELILYRGPGGATRVDVHLAGDTFWLSQRQMAELFCVDVRTVNEQLRNIYATDEPEETATLGRSRSVQRLN